MRKGLFPAAGRALKRGTSYRHERVIDFMLANPYMTKGRIAEELGYTQGWLATLTATDAFKAEYARRRGELDGEVKGRVVSKLFDVAEKATDRIRGELDKGEECDARFANSALQTVLKAAGFAAPPSTGPTAVQNVVVVATPGAKDALREARERIAGPSPLLEADVGGGD